MKEKIFAKAEYYWELYEIVSDPMLKENYQISWNAMVELIHDLDLYEEYKAYYLNKVK